MKAEIENIVIVGMGALGILYGDLFTRTLGKDAATFLANEKRIAKFQEDGVYCNGKKCDFKMASKMPAADLLVFAVKGTGLDAAMKEAADVVGEDTIILSVLNGISSEEKLSECFGKEHVIHCIAQGMDAVKIGNKLTYAHAGELRIGVPKDEQEDTLKMQKLAMVEKCLESASVPYVVEEDILHRLWGKWMLNVGVNQTVMVYGGTYGTVQKPGEARDTMIAAQREVIAVANALGVGLDESDLERWLGVLAELGPDNFTSMAQDALAGRPTEVDSFAKTMIELGERTGVPVPVNTVLYGLLKGREAALARR